jgi:hypothetical protein
MDDVRDYVRNSQADQNQYRALCQFYVTSPPNPPFNSWDGSINSRNRIRVSWGMRVLLCIRGIWGCMISWISDGQFYHGR